MKKFWLAVTIKDKIDEKDADSFYSYAVSVTEGQNLKSALDSIKGLQFCNVFATKKAAVEVVSMWNDSYKANGTYLFANPGF